MRFKVTIARSITHSTEFEMEMADAAFEPDKDFSAEFDGALERLVANTPSPHWQFMSDETEILDIQDVPQRG